MRAIFFILSLIVFSSSSMATPKHVIIIRHGEKIPGQNHLNLKGYERAAALAYYFSGTPQYNNPPITHMFAAGPDTSSSSVRPIQTCTPIANRYHIPLEIDFKEHEFKELAKELLTKPMYDNQTVLVCWSHDEIADLVQALGGDNPGEWQDEVFDQVYMLTFEENNKPTFQKILQKLMYGDRSTFQDQPPALPAETKRRPEEDY